jgi:hypothetical protein
LAPLFTSAGGAGGSFGAVCCVPSFVGASTMHAEFDRTNSTMREVRITRGF